jgi:hypothetical protein
MLPRVNLFVVVVDQNDVTDRQELDPRFAVNCIMTGVSSVSEFLQPDSDYQLTNGDAEFSGIVVDLTPESIRQVVDCLTRLNSSTANGLKTGVSRDIQDEPGTPVAALVVDRIDQAFSGEVFADPTIVGLALLMGPRARHGTAVFRREAFGRIGDFRLVSEPVWDWAIRAARAGLKIELIESVVPSSGRRSEAEPSRLPHLSPNRPGNDADWLQAHLREASQREMGCGLLSLVDQTAVRAGLFQWHDFLEESHQLSQSIEGEGSELLGDYWHAIMHRREPDYGNAKYWFRRLGNQPIVRELQSYADVVLSECRAPQADVWRDRLQSGSKWNPLAFVDLCEACAANENSLLAIAARRIQYAEMNLLMRSAVDPE